MRWCLVLPPSPLPLHLEELSIKLLRSLAKSKPISISSPRPLSLPLKELYNGQCFSSLITQSPNL